VFNPHAAASTLPTAFPDRSRSGSEHPPAAGSDPRSTPTRLPARCCAEPLTELSRRSGDGSQVASSRSTMVPGRGPVRWFVHTPLRATAPAQARVERSRRARQACEVGA
jgi:hypothetical protein